MSPVVVIYSPPGMGKTYLLVVVAWSHAMMRQQILVVTPSNEAANSFASHLLSIQCATPQLQRAPIIQYHAYNVECQIMITLNTSNPNVTASPLSKHAIPEMIEISLVTTITKLVDTLADEHEYDQLHGT